MKYKHFKQALLFKVGSVNKNGKYKRVSWHDDRFYTKDIRTNKIQTNQNYIEIVIKDYATFVVCQTDNGYKILEPIQK